MRESKGDVDLIEAVGEHIAKHIGEPSTVLHEIASPDIHLDVFVVEPTETKPYFVLVTCGMCEKAMRAPKELSDSRFAELVIGLPPLWPMTDKAFEQEENYWPIRILKGAARYPHEQKTWLDYGHSIAWADPPEPLAANTRMNSIVLLRPRLFPEAARSLRVSKEKCVQFWGLYPIHGLELEYKLQNDAERLEELFVKKGITELLDIRRECVVAVH